MKIKILLIEDNEQNLYLETFILEKYGYEVIQACNGKDGICLAKKKQTGSYSIGYSAANYGWIHCCRRAKKNQGAR